MMMMMMKIKSITNVLFYMQPRSVYTASNFVR